jgi:hypothetical protein
MLILKIIFKKLKNIILIYFIVKYILKNNHYRILKHLKIIYKFIFLNFYSFMLEKDYLHITFTLHSKYKNSYN